MVNEIHKELELLHPILQRMKKIKLFLKLSKKHIVTNSESLEILL